MELWPRECLDFVKLDFGVRIENMKRRESVKQVEEEIQKLKKYLEEVKNHPALRLPPVSMILAAIYEQVVEIEKCMKNS